MLIETEERCPITQNKYLTVAEALQAAVRSVLTHKDLKYNKSFFYWAAFISHGYASVTLDDALLSEIHKKLMDLQRKSSDDEIERDGKSGSEESLGIDMLALTRESYFRLEKAEQTLSREWCDEWDEMID